MSDFAPGDLLRVKEAFSNAGELRYIGQDGYVYDPAGTLVCMRPSVKFYKFTDLTPEDVDLLRKTGIKLKLRSKDKDALARLAANASSHSFEAWRRSIDLYWDFWDKIIDLSEPFGPSEGITTQPRYRYDTTYFANTLQQHTMDGAVHPDLWLPLACFTLANTPISDGDINVLNFGHGHTAQETPEASETPSNDKVLAKQREKELIQRVAELELILETQPAEIPESQDNPPIGKYCGKPCCGSMGICGTPTYGWGKLDSNGYWEYPCYYCANKEYPVADQELENSHDDLPSMEQMMTKTIENVQARTCGICNKTLKDVQGLQSHQRQSPKCSRLIAATATRIATGQIVNPPVTVVPSKLESVALAEIDYKKDVMRMHVLQAVTQTAIRCFAVAAPVCLIIWRLW